MPYILYLLALCLGLSLWPSAHLQAHTYSVVPVAALEPLPTQPKPKLKKLKPQKAKSRAQAWAKWLYNLSLPIFVLAGFMFYLAIGALAINHAAYQMAVRFYILHYLCLLFWLWMERRAERKSSPEVRLSLWIFELVMLLYIATSVPLYYSWSPTWLGALAFVLLILGLLAMLALYILQIRQKHQG